MAEFIASGSAKPNSRKRSAARVSSGNSDIATTRRRPPFEGIWEQVRNVSLTTFRVHLGSSGKVPFLRNLAGRPQRLLASMYSGPLIATPDESPHHLSDYLRIWPVSFVLKRFLDSLPRKAVICGPPVQGCALSNQMSACTQIERIIEFRVLCMHERARTLWHHATHYERIMRSDQGASSGRFAICVHLTIIPRLFIKLMWMPCSAA